MKPLKIIFIALALFAVNIYAQKASLPLRNGITWDMTPAQVEQLETAALDDTTFINSIYRILPYTLTEDGLNYKLWYIFNDNKLRSAIKFAELFGKPDDYCTGEYKKVKDTLTKTYPDAPAYEDDDFTDRRLETYWNLQDAVSHVEVSLGGMERDSGTLTVVYYPLHFYSINDISSQTGVEPELDYGVKFGMRQDEVTKLEPGKLTDDPHMLSYEHNENGCRKVNSYEFRRNVLALSIISSEYKAESNETAIMNYETVKDKLISSYGKPTQDVLMWESYVDDNDYKLEPAPTFNKGYLRYETFWNLKNLYIQISFYGTQDSTKLDEYYRLKDGN